MTPRILVFRFEFGETAVSSSPAGAVLVVESDLNAGKAADPLKNPSYPQRVHIRERAYWRAILQTWEDRIAEAHLQWRTEVAAAGAGTNPGRSERALHQMTGARDQIADAVRRLPMEVGELYEEDKHRVEEAVAALERLFARW